MKKFIVLFMTVIVLFSLFMTTSYATDTKATKSCVVDRNNSLSAQSEAKILEVLHNAEIETDITFIVIVHNTGGGLSYVENIASNLGFDIDREDIVLLEIKNSSTNYYDVYTWGIAYTVITDAEINDILDAPDVYNNIKGGNFEEGIISFVDLTVKAINSYRRNLILILIGISLVAGGVAVISVIVIYKRKLKSPVYPLSQYTDLELTESSDVFLNKTVTRTKVSSSSGGGSSGGRSSGGHRGGR